MPIEGKRTYIGHLDPDFSTHLQGKSFTRSVSIGESTADNSTRNDQISAYAGSCGASSNRPVAIAAAATRSVSGGDIEFLSPSPLSSFTATASTVSTNSPLPPNASPDTTIPLDEQVSDTVAAVMTTDSSGSNTSGDPSFNSLGQTLPSVSQRKAMLNDPDSRRTMNLLIHLLDTSLPPEWRNELLRSWSIIGSTLTSPGSDVPDGDFILNQQTVVPSVNSETTLKAGENSLSDEASVIKRVRLNESKASDQKSSVIENDFKDTRNASHKTFISPGLISSVSRLTDIFESRYHEKLGNLIDDVARLSRPDNSASVRNSDSEVTRQSSWPLSSGVEDASLDEKIPDTLSEAHQRFNGLLSTLFEERINWGRVVAMLAFLRAICAVAETKRITSCQPAMTPTISDNQSLDQEVQVVHSQPESEATPNSGVAPELAMAGDAGKPASNAVCAQGTSQDVDGAVACKRLSTSSAINGEGSSDGTATVSPQPTDYLFWTAAFIHEPNGIWNWITSNGGWEGLIHFESDPGISGEGGYSAANLQRSLIPFPDDDTIRLLQRAVSGVAALAVGAVGIAAAVRFFSRRL